MLLTNTQKIPVNSSKTLLNLLKLHPAVRVAQTHGCGLEHSMTYSQLYKWTKSHHVAQHWVTKKEGLFYLRSRSADLGSVFVTITIINIEETDPGSVLLMTPVLIALSKADLFLQKRFGWLLCCSVCNTMASVSNQFKLQTCLGLPAVSEVSRQLCTFNFGQYIPLKKLVWIPTVAMFQTACLPIDHVTFSIIIPKLMSVHSSEITSFSPTSKEKKSKCLLFTDTV